MARRTKIVATIGPASSSPAVLHALVAAGIDVARLGLAHGPVENQLETLRLIRKVAADQRRVVGVLADLPGPKIRAGEFPDGGVFFAEGDRVALVPGNDSSGATCIEVDHATLLDDLAEGDMIALGDGGIELRVDSVGAAAATATAVSGGRVQGRPGVNLPPGKVITPTPTPEDLRLLDEVVCAGVDMVAVSFVQAASDMERVRAAAGPDGPFLVAKIETPAALDDLDAIIAASDGVMVARGDLGVRARLEDVPHHQKRIIRSCVAYGVPVITATQMLESMVYAPTPTRAEVSDVANAVFDGTDAVMLSAETAIGHDPVLVVRTMARIAERAEREADYVAWGKRLGRLQKATLASAPPALRVTSAITAAGWAAAVEVEAKVIICSTRSGATARAMARFRPTAPILAVSPTERTARQLTLTWGTLPVAVNVQNSTDDIVWIAVEQACRLGLAGPGDIVAVLAGSPEAPDPATDVLRLVRVH